MKRIGFLLLAISFLACGCVARDTQGITAGAADTVSSATHARYRENEVTDYQGARLDPAIGPRDNSISGVQEVDINGFLLTVDGLVDRETAFSYEEALSLLPYERLITLHCVEGWDATILWKGVLLGDLIGRAGAKPEAVTVIFTAADGYTTSLPLTTVLSKELILAYNANGLPLPPEMGYPFIVVAEEKLGYKWARWVNHITLSDDAGYLGFWENNGYSNEANINQ